MNVTQRINKCWKGVGRRTFSYEKWPKSTKDIERNSSRIQQERKERTKGKAKPYHEIKRE